VADTVDCVMQWSKLVACNEVTICEVYNMLILDEFVARTL